MQLPEAAGPSGYGPEPDEVQISQGERPEEAIYTCKFPGCTRQYASTDGVRKHCRKSHPEWLREVDLDKANHGCRWAAYCTREPIADGDNSLRSPTVGSKRARDSLGGQGSALPPTEGSVPNPMKPTNPAAAVPRRLPESAGDDVVDPRPARITVEHKPRHAPHGVAMDGKSALVPLRYPSSRENLMPPEMITIPGELSSPLPANVSALTPNAQARQRLGEIADSESACLQGCASAVGFGPTSPVENTSVLTHSMQAPNSFFVQWGMPPLKRGLSLADTREAAAAQAMQAQAAQAELDGASAQDSPSFLDSILA